MTLSHFIVFTTEAGYFQVWSSHRTVKAAKTAGKRYALRFPDGRYTFKVGEREGPRTYPPDHVEAYLPGTSFLTEYAI